MRALRLAPIHIAIFTAFNPPAFAEEDTTVTLSPVVVTATRQAQNSFDLPVAIDVVDQKNIQDGQQQMFLSESLIRVPGMTAQNRNNQAQDPQISTRGFGSRSAFGVRGVRVYVDGIPLTMPDGQGQPGVVDLAAIKSIEVMRGPFSSLYGNSSGGVIQMLTKDAPQTPQVSGTAMFGSYDTQRQGLEAAGQLENMEYLLNTSNFETNGFRDHGKGHKKMATARFKMHISEDTKITTLVNWFEQSAQDPLGLNRTTALSKSTRDQAITAASLANTGVKRDHTQIGFNFEHTFNANNKINFTPYIGTRSNAQTLTTTPLATTLATTRARLSQIDREFYGADLRWDHSGDLGVWPYQLSMGITYGKSTDDRTDTNILTNGVVTNTANRDEKNISTNFDQYMQGKLSVTPSVDLHAGARHTKVRLQVKDSLLIVNGDNSGSVEYQKTTPVIGAIWKATDTLNVYANFGKGFETPTFIESAYDNVSSGVASKPNLNLKASESNNTEVGLKAFVTDNTRLNLTLFYITTKNEIVADRTVVGRSSYVNANDSKRTGAELSIDSVFENGISTYFAYTSLNARFDSDYTTTSGNLVASGNRIPGTYKKQIYGEVAWRDRQTGLFTALEARYNGDVYVNDINSEKAPSYTIVNLRTGFEQELSKWHFKEYLRFENITDKTYVGSVRINDSNGLFYETGAGRNYLLGLSAQYKF